MLARPASLYLAGLYTVPGGPPGALFGLLGPEVGAPGQTAAPGAAPGRGTDLPAMAKPDGWPEVSDKRLRPGL